MVKDGRFLGIKILLFMLTCTISFIGIAYYICVLGNVIPTIADFTKSDKYISYIDFKCPCTTFGFRKFTIATIHPANGVD